MQFFKQSWTEMGHNLLIKILITIIIEPEPVNNLIMITHIQLIMISRPNLYLRQVTTYSPIVILTDIYIHFSDKTFFSIFTNNFIYISQNSQY